MVNDSHRILVPNGGPVGNLLNELRDYDNDTYEHSIYVASILNSISQIINLNDYQREELMLGGLLHDIGKLDMPTKLLCKCGPLSDEEYIVMKTHCLFGYERVKSAGVSSKVSNIVKYHHERVDGSGYLKLTSHQIPVEAKIVAIADVYCAMTENRPYRKGFESEEAIQHIITNPQFFDITTVMQNSMLSINNK